MVTNIIIIKGIIRDDHFGPMAPDRCQHPIYNTISPLPMPVKHCRRESNRDLHKGYQQIPPVLQASRNALERPVYF